MTGVVIALFPWGMPGPLRVIFLLGYCPIAFVVLRSTWAATPVDGPAPLPSRRDRNVLRVACAVLGLAIAAAAAASGGSWLAVVPGVVVALSAITPAWHSLIEAVGEMREHPITLLVTLNVLNVVDVMASDAAIRAGEAAELNPFVGATGTGVKLALVLGCSLLLFRLRPAALVWPTLAFVGLAIYHLTGWLVMV